MRLPKMSLLRVSALFLLYSATACSILGPEGDEIKLRNQTGGTILFLAMELQTSHLFDPAPTLSPNPGDSRVLSPGASRILRPGEVMGGYETGDDLRFFFYEVSGEAAHYKSMLTVTAAELRRADYRISIEEFQP